MKCMEQENKITIESLAGRVDSLAQTVKDGFAEMATKQDIATVETKIDGIHAELRNHPTRSDLERELKKYRYAKEIDGISGRVAVCEQKLGIEPPLDLELGLE
jgi:hypothetical protein